MVKTILKSLASYQMKILGYELFVIGKTIGFYKFYSMLKIR
jgi:hypothetical protein